MTSPRQAKWLVDELPELVRAEVISPEAAEALERHYAGAAGEARSWATTLFAILGAALVGGGTILLLAHNWHQLSRPARTVVSLLPLVVGQALALWALARDRDSAAWREGVGTFLFISVGASIALVAQTYHLPGDLAAFLLTWMLLGLPVAYLLDASLPLLLYLAGIAGWVYSGPPAPQELAFWALLALAVPHLVLLARRGTRPGWERVVAWALALCAAVAVPEALVDKMPVGRAGALVYSCLAAAIFLAGSGWGGGAAWSSALRRAGVLGVAVTVLVLSFEGLWSWSSSILHWQLSTPISILVFGLGAALALTALGLLALRFGRLDTFGRLAGALPLATGVAILGVEGSGRPAAAMAVMSLYALALGLAAVLQGASGTRWIGHAGMALLAALVAVRFFDSELSFLWRGVGFVLAGSLFLGLNLVLSRRWRRGT